MPEASQPSPEASPVSSWLPVPLSPSRPRPSLQPLQLLGDARLQSSSQHKLLSAISSLGLCPVIYVLGYYFTQSKRYLLKYQDKNLYKGR